MGHVNSERIEGYDAYISHLCAPEDEALRAARERSTTAALPAINISAAEGKLLHVLARSIQANRILEIGTLGGYSGIWLARALPPGGTLVTLEINPNHADVARENFERAALAARVDIRLGPAADALKKMRADREPLFDLIFIDADKEAYVRYLDLSLPLLRVGGMLLADNTLSDAVLDPTDQSHTKPYNAAAAAHPQLMSILTPVLRNGGIDGVMISIKIESQA